MTDTHKQLMMEAAEAVRKILPESYAFNLIATDMGEEIEESLEKDPDTPIHISNVSNLELHSARMLVMRWVNASLLAEEPMEQVELPPCCGE